MKKKLLTSALALVMAAGVILTPANVKAATVNEVEPNNTEDTASRINVGDVYQENMVHTNYIREMVIRMM